MNFFFDSLIFFLHSLNKIIFLFCFTFNNDIMFYLSILNYLNSIIVGYQMHSDNHYFVFFTKAEHFVFFLCSLWLNSSIFENLYKFLIYYNMLLAFVQRQTINFEVTLKELLISNIRKFVFINKNRGYLLFTFWDIFCCGSIICILFLIKNKSWSFT